MRGARNLKKGYCLVMTGVGGGVRFPKIGVRK